MQNSICDGRKSVPGAIDAETLEALTSTLPSGHVISSRCRTPNNVVDVKYSRAGK